MKIFILVSLLLVGCVSTSVETKDPFERPPSQARPAYLTNAEEGLFYGIVETIVDPHWLKTKRLGGSCQIKTPNTNIQTACLGKTILLQSRKGEVLSRATTDQGDFSFPVEPNKEYYLQVESQKEKKGPFKMGDRVQLTLSTKPSKTH